MRWHRWALVHLSWDLYVETFSNFLCFCFLLFVLLLVVERCCKFVCIVSLGKAERTTVSSCFVFFSCFWFVYLLFVVFFFELGSSTWHWPLVVVLSRGRRWRDLLQHLSWSWKGTNSCTQIDNSCVFFLCVFESMATQKKTLFSDRWCNCYSRWVSRIDVDVAGSRMRVRHHHRHRHRRRHHWRILVVVVVVRQDWLALRHRC